MTDGDGRVRVLFLDIDGTVRQGKDDELGRFVNSAEDVRVFPDAVAQMRRWRERGGRIVGVSNQGGIALGLVSPEAAMAAMEETDRQTGNLFDLIMMCPHHPAAADPVMARCWCRKPSPGLVVLGARQLMLEHPAETYPACVGLMVGDRDEDAECARLAGLDFVHAREWRSHVWTEPG